MRTQSVIVRLPAKLVDSIDILVNGELFASRASFILSSIWHRLPILMGALQEEAWKLLVIDVSVRGKHLAEQINQMFNRERLGYLQYTGEPVRINVRVPKGIMNLWDNINENADGLFPFQDFVRYSATAYLDLWSEALLGGVGIKELITKILPKEEEESLKNTIKGRYFSVKPPSEDVK